jgi:hypothetical protein
LNRDIIKRRKDWLDLRIGHRFATQTATVDLPIYYARLLSLYQIGYSCCSYAPLCSGFANIKHHRSLRAGSNITGLSSLRRSRYEQLVILEEIPDRREVDSPIGILGR